MIPSRMWEMPCLCRGNEFFIVMVRFERDKNLICLHVLKSGPFAKRFFFVRIIQVMFFPVSGPCVHVFGLCLQLFASNIVVLCFCDFRTENLQKLLQKLLRRGKLAKIGLIGGACHVTSTACRKTSGACRTISSQGPIYSLIFPLFLIAFQLFLSLKI